MPEPSTSVARSPRLGLPFLFAGQSQREVFVNEALARIDALLFPTVEGELAAPPAEPVSGASYIVSVGASGAWTGHDREMASWLDGTWLFTVAPEGASVRDKAAKGLAIFSIANGWDRVAPVSEPAGGGVQDLEARATIATILEGLRTLGIFSE